MTVKIATTLEKAKQELKQDNIPFIEVGTHGFVALRGAYGSDELIAQTARLTTASDKKDIRPLIRHLMRHWHTSPFENSHIDLDIALPIFVERQMARHRTAGWNELSGRYSELPAEQYEVPEHRFQKEPSSGSNRQGSGDKLETGIRNTVKNYLETALFTCVDAYRDIRSLKFTPELSRIILPLSTYTRKRWWIDLHNLMHFLNLRVKKDAQFEIREYADAIQELVRPHFPITFEAFTDFRLETIQFSRLDKIALGKMLKGETIDDVFDSKSELKEFWDKINMIND